jgi:type I restriction-modification system DNA methylase subunit
MPDKETAKQQIEILIKKYKKIEEENLINKYQEAETGKDFILPLFRALGWDTENLNEVTTEERISKKRVDYGFKINGISKFFVEAKSLKKSLDNTEYEKQAINYAWLKGCSWAVLTNFKKIKIFNAEWEMLDNPSQNLVKEISYEEFLTRFDELWLLSKESFEQGLLDKEAEKWGRKTKRIPVDKQLLADFTRFRELLSKNIAKLNQNENMTEEQLDESVQRILDRLIFIRNCEDRGLEEKTLISGLRDWESRGKGQLIKSLRKVFSYFNEQYDSEIFATHLCDSLEIDNEVLHEIIEGLYYTKDKSASYDFSAIEADVLGNIYEQYLGHILKKSEKRAKVVESYVHRKEQGIYYTPTYIVDYIVRNTLGKLLKNKKVDPEKIRVLDPACGSGSFLLKAFDILNEYYKEHDKNYSQTQLDTTGTGTTYSRKLKILQNNIFGVDLDKQAVEIAQLNLLLKVAEKGQRLPLLQKNIKCGNSLIDDPTVAGDKAFKWEEEFKEVMNEGGFDVIIGNPPYSGKLSNREKFYLKSRYPEVYSKDTAEYFIKKAIDLLKPGGIFGFIIPKSSAYYGKWAGIRKLLLDNLTLLKIADVGLGFFDVNLEEIIIIAKKEKPKDNYKITVERFSDVKRPKFKKFVAESEQVKCDIMRKNYILIFSPLSKSEQGIIRKIDTRSIKFSEILKDSFRGIYISDKDKLNLKMGSLKFIEKEPWIQRYSIKKFLMISKNEKFIDQDKVTKILQRKLIFKVIRGKRLSVYYDQEGELLTPSNIVNVIIKDETKYNYKFLLGLLNSKLISFYIQKSLFSDTTESARHVDYLYLTHFPLPKEVTLEKQQPIIQLVDKMLSLNKRLNEIGDKKTDERAKIEEEIKKTDAEIDELVYKIYDITKKEKEIIEKSLK